jgi:hypothetical protein
MFDHLSNIDCSKGATWSGWRTFCYRYYYKENYGCKILVATLVEIGQNVTTLFATINYLQLHLDIFTTISYVGHIHDYIAISLRLFWCSSFHVNNIWFGFHPRRTIYVLLIANVINLITTLWVYKGVFCEL